MTRFATGDPSLDSGGFEPPVIGWRNEVRAGVK